MIVLSRENKEKETRRRTLAFSTALITSVSLSRLKLIAVSSLSLSIISGELKDNCNPTFYIFLRISIKLDCIGSLAILLTLHID